MRRKGEEGMSKSRHTEAQMIVALKQLEAGREADDVAPSQGALFCANLLRKVCNSDQPGRLLVAYR